MTPPDPGFPITLDGLLKFWQLLGAPLVGAVFFYVRDISKQLRAMNGRIIKLESWTETHEKTDDDRFAVTTRELDQVQRMIHDKQRDGAP